MFKTTWTIFKFKLLSILKKQKNKIHFTKSLSPTSSSDNGSFKVQTVYHKNLKDWNKAFSVKINCKLLNLKQNLKNYMWLPYDNMYKMF